MSDILNIVYTIVDRIDSMYYSISDEMMFALSTIGTYFHSLVTIQLIFMSLFIVVIMYLQLKAPVFYRWKLADSGWKRYFVILGSSTYILGLLEMIPNHHRDTTFYQVIQYFDIVWSSLLLMCSVATLLVTALVNQYMINAGLLGRQDS
ncbi:hypothetical protein AB6A40_001161 [Gnathostoma spinigerum]|uniref:Uncharacterized protein n=1 Tax=Gnathostoma spinigerum TaxID=75299 RepID=A0ABD6ED79_9BILA